MSQTRTEKAGAALADALYRDSYDELLQLVSDVRDELQRLRDAVHVPGEWYARAEAASILRLSDTTVDNLITAGELSTVHEGTRTFVTRESLEAYQRRKLAAPRSRFRGPDLRAVQSLKSSGGRR